MALTHLKMFTFYLYFVFPLVCGGVLRVQDRDWMGNPPGDFSEGDVECFSEYMELWIHRMRFEGLRLWLSAMLRIQATPGSLELLSHQLSACGFGLHKDPDRNYIFRVMYSGCFVQQERGHYVIVLNLMKRISRFGGRTHNYVMKCPVVPAPPNTEYIQCDPDFVQVTRQIPVDSWNNELRWSLALSGNLVVALEDASLIQVNVDIQKPLITVQGRRNTVLSPVQVLQTEGQFLPLKLVSGQYAYSMEATCPNIIQPSLEDTVLHIYKRHMGLTKRGGYDNETLSVSSVSVNQTDTFTWWETTSYVQLTIPTTLIQKTKKCDDKESENLQQSFFRIDVVLTFKETNSRMLWTMENTSPCSNYDIPSVKTHQSVAPKSSFAFTAFNPTLLNLVTQEPLPFSRTESQISSMITGTGFAKTSQDPQATSVPGIVSRSADTGTHDVFRPTSFKANDYLNPAIPLTHALVTPINMGSDTTLVSLLNPLFRLHPESFMDFTNTRELSTVMPYEPSLSTIDNTVRSNTNDKNRKAVLFTPSHPETKINRNPMALSPYLEGTSTDVNPNTASDITLNTPPASVTPLQLDQRVTDLSLSPPHNDITVHPATTIIRTTHKGPSVQPEAITLESASFL